MLHSSLFEQFPVLTESDALTQVLSLSLTLCLSRSLSRSQNAIPKALMLLADGWSGLVLYIDLPAIPNRVCVKLH